MLCLYYTPTFEIRPNNFYDKLLQKILLDFYLKLLYDDPMFQKKTIKAYVELLDALPCAAEVRSFCNQVLAANEKGKDLFGVMEDPFQAFRLANNVQELKKLDAALLQKSHFQTELSTEDSLVQICLKPLHKAMLITATPRPLQFSVSQVVQTQLNLFKNILQNIHVPIYLIDISGEIIYINAEFSSLIGYPYEQILGQQLTTFLNFNQLKFEPHFETDLVVSTPQGSCPFMLWQEQIETSNAPLFVGMLQPVVVSPFNEISEPLPFPYAQIAKETYAILKTNALFLKMCEMEKAPQLLGDVFTPETLKNLEDILARVHKSDAIYQSIELVTLKGDTYQVYLTQNNSDSEALNLYFIDISSHKNLENQILQSHKMQAIGQLTGGIAHDFNNILTAIMGFTDLLLQQHPAGDDSFVDLMHIKGNVQKAAGLVGQLLTFSRKTPVHEYLISVHDSFVDLTSLLQRAIAPNCHLKIEYKRNLGFVKMDINQLTQVFLNFAVNAKDAMPKGGTLTITLNKEEIKKMRPCGNDTMPAGSYIKIMVADTGCGIQPDILPHIFDPFFTTKKKSNQSGTGLGLSTVYGIIHSAGGFIKVNSEPNIGTTFTVYLPRFESETQPVATPPTEIQNVFLPEAKAPILLVDDEESIRSVTARALTLKDFEVIQAPNAEEALKILKNNQSLQLLITDMVMPGMNGEELIKEAKKIYPDLPCLLMSGYSESFEKHTSDQAKNFYFIAKPFVLADLLTKIKEILEKNKKL